MKVIITGGLGFIGINLAKNLLKNGHEVTLLDNLSTQIHGDLPVTKKPEGAKFIRTNINKLTDKTEFIEGTDAVFHFAAETGTGQSMDQILHYTQGNCVGTASLLNSIKKCKLRPKRIILASSRSIYGEGAYRSLKNPEVLLTVAPRSKVNLDSGIWEPLDSSGGKVVPVPTPENFPFEPSSLYAATKAAQELLVKSTSNALGIKAIILRFQNVYGEGQSLRNPYTGIISIFYNRARQGLDIPIFEDGHESRDFVHICDVVDALASSLEVDLPNNTVLNIGTGTPTTVLSLAKELVDVSGQNVSIKITGQYRLGDIRHCFADISKASKMLGYKPKISLKEGLQKFCSWAAKEPVYEDRSVAAQAELVKYGFGK